MTNYEDDDNNEVNMDREEEIRRLVNNLRLEPQTLQDLARRVYGSDNEEMVYRVRRMLIGGPDEVGGDAMRWRPSD